MGWGEAVAKVKSKDPQLHVEVTLDCFVKGVKVNETIATADAELYGSDFLDAQVSCQTGGLNDAVCILWTWKGVKRAFQRKRGQRRELGQLGYDSTGRIERLESTPKQRSSNKTIHWPLR